MSWARAGVGAVATQATAELSYGPLGLELMSAGRNASESLQALLKADKRAEVRQVSFVDANGKVAAHTGKKCIPYAGHTLGKGVSCQGNIMRNKSVWGAMRRAYETSRLPFAERLLEALDAGEEAGGDFRGKQSAAILIVSGKPKPSAWQERLIDLRVEDHHEPLKEIRRLLKIQRAYESVEEGIRMARAKKMKAARVAYARGLSLLPGDIELKFWTGMSLLDGKDRAAGVSMVREVLAENRNWQVILKRMLRAGSVEVDRPVARRLLRGSRETT